MSVYDERVRLAGGVVLTLLVLGGLVGVSASSRTVTLSIVGTTDVHGNIFPRDGRGGIEMLGGYVKNLRAARAADDGAVLLLDAGDAFQGGVESNLSEGAVLVDAYNALGYAALAIGNHEFDFGSRDLAGARQDANADPRGALKALAARAQFPFLAANLIDDETGQPVAWPNVKPSVTVQAAGAKIGIIGVMTAGALRATLPFNVHGLSIAPLPSTIAREATTLRAAGADVVIVVAHAGGGCARFDDPDELSSCDYASEIFSVAYELPEHLVDVIVAGHTHDRIAHRVNGIAIVQAGSFGRAFSRVDVTVDRANGGVTATRVFAPRDICPRQDPMTLACAPGGGDGTAAAARYEDRDVMVDAAIERAMAPELARVRALQAQPLGTILDAGVARSSDFNSPIGNLFADAMREENGADVAINNNAIGGPRADLAAGPITFGRLYDTFPFDNRVGRVTLNGAQLQQVFETAIRRGRRGALGVSGIHVTASCDTGRIDVRLFRPSGSAILPTDTVTVAAMDAIVFGQTFAPVAMPGGMEIPNSAPIVREQVEDWLRQHGGVLPAAPFVSLDARRVELAPACLE